jgi:hypothetical protein
MTDSFEFEGWQARPQAKLTLTAAPAAESYYPHIGMTKHDSCWTLRYGEFASQDKETIVIRHNFRHASSSGAL